MIKIISIFAIVIALATSAKVFDLAGTFTNFKCLKDLGYQHSIIRAYHSYGAIDITAP